MRERLPVAVALVTLLGAACGGPKQPTVVGPRLTGERITVVEFTTDTAAVNYSGPIDALGLALASEIAAELRRRGYTAEAVRVTSVPSSDTLVRGRILRIDGGSRATRFWVGFGAGRAGVAADGEVARGDGTPLASFRDERSSSGMADAWGGSSEALIPKCVRAVGHDIATMIDTGQYRQ